MKARALGSCAASILFIFFSWVTGCREEAPARPADPPAASRPADSPAPEPAPGSPSEPLPQTTVTLYFPSTEENGLIGENRRILVTAAPGDRAKQILSDLLAGPAAESAASFIPAGTKLRQVYFLESGTAFADFSAELASGIAGGSDAELLTVFSIVNSIVLNVPEIFRVGILVEGKPCETLSGHVDLRRPLGPDRKLVLGTRGESEPDDVVQNRV